MYVHVAEWEERWVQSTHKSDYGKFKWTAGKFYGDEEKDKGQLKITSEVCRYCVTFGPFSFTPGIQTSENAKFYARSASFDSFSNEGKTLVVQFTVKHEQKIDCGGGYLKVSITIPVLTLLLVQMYVCVGVRGWVV